MRNRRTTILFPVFGAEVRVIFARDIKITALRLGEPDMEGTKAVTIYDSKKPERLYIIFPLEPDEGMISHEAYHAAIGLLKNHDIPCSEEMVAYHADYIVLCIHKFLKK